LYRRIISWTKIGLIALLLLIDCLASGVACTHLDENAVSPKLNTLNIPN
jgi:hypothetical protein